MALEFQEAGSHQARASRTTVFSLLPLALENDEEDEQERRYENPGDRGHERSADGGRSAAGPGGSGDRKVPRSDYLDKLLIWNDLSTSQHLSALIGVFVVSSFADLA